MNQASSRDEQLFADVLARPEQERAAFLAGACNGDAALRARIIALLAAHAGPDSLLSSLPVQPTTAHEERPGEAIGRYKLLQKIGEGGCGVVWMAEQEEPVRRRVALKVIKLGMDTKAVVARFEAERQALAMMDHPNIAKVLDGGATDLGRPYFVMELVRGIPITRFCDDNNLPTRERLNLFIQVCHAIQHAHQKGIIHRDIKPSNVLVTLHDDVAMPAVIDFGIAKATQGRLTDSTLFTAFEQFIGTPVYMSPEQAEYNALDVDTRSDIYSLGVLLYELLTGRPPFDPKTLTAAGLDQVRKIIRESEPPRPSTRFRTLADEERTTVAKLRGTAPTQLSTLLRGDLDWIVMKALEKNRVRRYQTANAFAMDVQRYLAHEPIVARPPSATYRVRKFAVRHKVAFAAGSFVALTLIVGIVVSTTMYIRQRETEQAAAGARLQAENLLSFVFTGLEEELDDVGHLSLMAEVSARAIAYYEGLPVVLQTRDTRASHAFAIATSGFVLAKRGEIATALPRLDGAMETFLRLESEGPLTPFMRVAYGFTAAEAAPPQFRVLSAREKYLSLLDRGERVLQPAIADEQWGGWAQRTLTRVLRMKGAVLNTSEGVEALRRAITSAELADRRLPMPSFPGLRTAEIMGELSDLLARNGNRAEAREMAHEASVRLRGFIERAPYLTNARRALDVALRARAKLALADWDFAGTRAALEESRQQLGYLQKVDPRSVTTLLLAPSWSGGLGGHFGRAGHLETSSQFPTVGEFALAWMSGDFAAAERVLRKGLEVLSEDRMTPAFRSHLLSARVNLARLYAATGRDEEAERQLLEADAVLRRVREERNLSGSTYEVNLAIGGNYFRVVAFERLDWPAMRENAEEELRRLSSGTTVASAIRGHFQAARRDLIRAAHEMGDSTAARRELELWSPSPLPDHAGMQNRFDHIGNQLTRIHIVARAGDRETARRELAAIWLEIEEVHAAGRDQLFNQVQTARALSIRAEIDGTGAEKRAWLERALQYLQPAADAGKLTRYEREVLLAGIRKQLAALAEPATP